MSRNRSDIHGSELVTKVFGYWPTFHDAEVVRLELVRAGRHTNEPDLLADIHAFEITDEIAPSGQFVLRHHVLVSFRFRGVDRLRLEDWNHHNALFGLNITNIRDHQLEVLEYEVSFDGSFGVQVEFFCRSVEVESVRPWESERTSDGGKTLG